MIRSARRGVERHVLAADRAQPCAHRRREDHEHAEHQDRGENGVECSGEAAFREKVVEDRSPSGVERRRRNESEWEHRHERVLHAA